MVEHEEEAAQAAKAAEEKALSLAYGALRKAESWLCVMLVGVLAETVPHATLSLDRSRGYESGCP